MRRGQTLEIKTSSVTASTGSMAALVAAVARVLSPKQLEDRWTVSVLMSAERSSLAQASVTS